MNPAQDKYPLFEANQVLTNAHLNQAINYLDEQERLTRANLIGIGIVCGLEISINATKTTITIAKGCGISSDGYLLAQARDIVLRGYKEYLLPEEKDGGKYSAFLKADKTQYTLWELIEDNKNNEASSNPWTPLDLSNYVVVLFLELKKDNLRNCSINNCDDYGSKITATIRYLLIAKTDLDSIIAKANKLADGLSSFDLEAVLLARLNLADLRLPRYDVPNSNLTSSNDILTAFHTVFSTDKLANQLGDALDQTYEAFKPIVQALYPSNPFASFKAKFGFLDTVPISTDQVRFLQYYYDFFDDLINAYDEFRWKAVALLCACCPSEKLFPRHLMLGLTVETNSSVYRNSFIASSANTNCAERTKEVVLLFHRLVEMIAQFTDTPLSPLLKPSRNDKTDTQIHITPSQLADVPLSDKAIPYYYQQSGEPPLFMLWNPKKTRHNRANQNLSYRSYQYQPVAPVFITDPLRYDLEPYNFLRIEGHLGKNYQSVMNTLLTLKARYRLPIEVIALRTSAFDNTIAIDLTKEASKFQDLEALYDVLREELLSNLCEGMMYLYDIVIDGATNLSGGTPAMPLLKTCTPNYRYKANAVGAWYEKYLTRIQAIPYIDVNQNAIDANELFLVYCQLFSGTVAPDPKYYAHIVSIYYFSKLAEILPLSLSQLGYANFENKYQDLLGLTRYFRGTVQVSTDLQQFIPREDLIDHFDQVLFSCKLQAIKAVYDEYLRRLRELKQKQFLSDFLQKNPAIQHKAGVPLGGTFIIVYHDNPTLAAPPINFTFNPAMLKTTSEQAMSAAFTRLQSKQNFVLDSDFQLIFSELTGQSPLLNPSVFDVIQSTALDEIMDETISEFTDGDVIADFYLPYRFNADGQAIQFVLPKIPPTFTLDIGCTKLKSRGLVAGPIQVAQVTITPESGLPPYTLILDDTPPSPIQGKAAIFEIESRSNSYNIVIQDAEGIKSAPQTFTIPPLFFLDEPTYKCYENGNKYKATISINGGTPDYSKSEQTQTDDKEGIIQNNDDGSYSYTTDSIDNGTTRVINVLDSRQCAAEIEITHTCVRPTFSATVECPHQGSSKVNIVPEGGLSPYSVKIDEQEYQSLDEDLYLQAGGNYSLTIRDAEDTESIQKTVVVPSPIMIEEQAFKCSEDGSSYTTTVIISGGTPPYTANGTVIDGNIYTTEQPTASRDDTYINVVDSNQCIKLFETRHSCQKPCDLPCAGIAIRRGYYFSLPNVKENDFQVSFLFESQTGEMINLSEKAHDILQNVAGDSESFAKQINALIAETTGSSDWLKFDYSSSKSGFMDTWWIEYFECLKFDFGFKYPLGVIVAVVPITTVMVTPTTNRVLITQGGKTLSNIIIPTFNGIKIDKCNPESPAQPLCPKELDLKLEIIKQLVDLEIPSAFLDVKPFGTDEPVVYLWEVLGANPAISNGQQATFELTDTGNHPMRLTAFTKDRCRFIQEDTIFGVN